MKHRLTGMAVRVALLWACLGTFALPGAEPARGTNAPTRLLAHYMPWYQAKPFSRTWGWHWTMNVFTPDQSTAGRPQIASHLTPVIGPYDSADPHVLEYHLLTMKVAGIDGVIVDWYGLEEFRDYRQLHRNTERLVEQVKRLGMQFAICYEDQTIPALVDAGRIKAADRVTHAVKELDWLAEHWFNSENYVQLNGRPVLLSFGQAGLSDDEWSQCLERVKLRPVYFSLHRRRSAAQGGFDWPLPKEGWKAVERFQQSRKSWSSAIPVAFPRFIDIYQEAKVGPSYGRIDDENGDTFRKTLDAALAARTPLVQIATWNDWGEGTVVEPSREYGFRDLEWIQEQRRKRIDGQFSAQAADLRLPFHLYELRRKSPGDDVSTRLDQVAQQIATGRLREARSLLEQIVRE